MDNSSETRFNEGYWSERWKKEETGWDLGEASLPLKTYIEQLTNKDLRILLPGAGNAYEGILLHQLGFHLTDIVDLSAIPLKRIHEHAPKIPAGHLIQADFFDLKGPYDLILEQTFFCALDPSLRRAYFEKMHQLLSTGGKLAGVLFNDTLNDDHPPFGGNAEEYTSYFRDLFEIQVFETCYNSIKPRRNRELFMILQKK